MSNPQRRAELKRLREAEDESCAAEERRVATLCLNARIEEIESIHDVKDVMRLIAEKAGLDIYND